MIIQLFPNKEIAIVHGRPGAPRSQPEEPRGLILTKAGAGGASPLDIAPQLSQTLPRADFKIGPMGQEARHKILKHTALMAPEDKHRQVFVTGTLPGSTEAALAAFSGEAGAVVKLVQTYLPRALGCSAELLDYVWVWEHQTRGALHMHLALQCPTPALAEKAILVWHEVWASVLRVIDSSISIDLFARKYGGSWAELPDKWVTDAALVKKAVGRYLSKYMSKGSPTHAQLRPPRWYGISRGLRQKFKDWVEANTFSIDLRIRPEIDLREVAAHVRDTLADFCVGPIGSRANRASRTDLSLFGYLKDIDLIGGFIVAILTVQEIFGDIAAPSEASRAFYASRRSALTRLRTQIRTDWPTWFWNDVLQLVPVDLLVKLNEGAEIDRIDAIDIAAAFDHVAGNGIPEFEWVRQSRTLLRNISRA